MNLLTFLGNNAEGLHEDADSVHLDHPIACPRQQHPWLLNISQITTTFTIYLYYNYIQPKYYLKTNKNKH